MTEHGRPRGSDPYFYGGPHHAHDSWWAGPAHLLLFILLVALLIAGVVWLVHRLAPAAMTRTATPAVIPAAAASAVDDPAVATLRMRYARDEVSRNDYRNAIEDLTGRPAATAAWPGGGSESSEGSEGPPGSEGSEGPPQPAAER